MFSALRRARGRMLREEDGAATIEAVIWLPVFFYILALSVDVTMIFHGYSKVIRVVEDVNRGISVGRIDTVDEGKTKIKAALSTYPDVAANISIIDGVVVTNVSVPVKSLAFIGAASSMMSKYIVISTQQYKEF